MLSETVQEGLSAYRIGERMRALRLKKKMGLVELGQHTGLSPALLSKIERGRLFPTLPTLLRIALVFSVGLEYFFAGSREQPLVAVVRKKQRMRFPSQPGARQAAYEFESLDFPATERRMNAYFAEFHAAEDDAVQVHDHPGAEFLYVLSGKLGVRVAGEEHLLDAGDSMYFDSALPHGYRRGSAGKCTAVVVTTP
ncbi:MAG: helix-turn-helix domain-containing protein [Bacteroidales bacterium]